LGIEVIQALRFKTDEDQLISSSEIRAALLEGDITHANRLLSYGYLLHGKVISGFKIGRKIGFPTANILPEDSCKLIPANGVYAVRVRWKSQTYKGMMNIGVRPTINNSDRISIEVHILDFNEDIYKETLEIDFIRKIRDEQEFKGVNELIEQLQKDKLNVISLDY